MDECRHLWAYVGRTVHGDRVAMCERCHLFAWIQ